MAIVILTLHYPKTGIVQTQEYPSIHQAIVVAHGHFAAFPEGYAQISDKESAEVVMPNEELRGTFEMSRQRDDMPGETADRSRRAFSRGCSASAPPTIRPARARPPLQPKLGEPAVDARGVLLEDAPLLEKEGMRCQTSRICVPT